MRCGNNDVVADRENDSTSRTEGAICEERERESQKLPRAKGVVLF